MKMTNLRNKICRQARINLSLCRLLLCYFSFFQMLHGQQQLQQEKTQEFLVKLTAIQLIKAEIENIENFPVEQQDIENQLLEFPGIHKSISASKPLITAEYKDKISTSLKGKLSDIYFEINADTEWVSLGWLAEQLNDKQDDIKLQSDIVIDKVMNIVYPAARSNAIRKQFSAKNISPIYPTLIEVQDIFYDKNERRKQEVFNHIKNRIIGEMKLFEENENKVDSLCKKIIENSGSQFSGQFETVEKSQASNFILKENIKNKLLEEVDNYIRKLKSEYQDRYYIYPIFPIINDVIEERSQLLTKNKFIEFLSSDEVCEIAMFRDIKQQIKNEVSKHINLETSISIIVENLVSNFKDEIIEIYLKKAKNQNVKVFKNSLRKMINTNQIIYSSLNQSLKNCIRDSLSVIRQEIAHDQVKIFYPEVYNNSWEVPETIILGYEEDNNIEKVYLDYKQKYKSTLLEESQTLLKKQMSNLIKNGYEALSSQRSLIIRMKDEIEKKTNNIEDDQIVYKIYKDSVTYVWNKKKKDYIWKNIPFENYMRTKYDSVFDSNEKLIQDLISKFYKQGNNEYELETIGNSRLDGYALGEKHGGGERGGQGGGSGNGLGPGVEGNVSMLEEDDCPRLLAQYELELSESKELTRRLSWIIVLLCVLLLITITYMIYRLKRK